MSSSFVSSVQQGSKQHIVIPFSRYGADDAAYISII